MAADGKSSARDEPVKAFTKRSFLKFYRFTRSDLPLLWRVLPIVNLLTCFLDVCGMFYLLKNHFNFRFYLRTIDGYDRGTFTLLLTVSCAGSCLASSINYFVTSRQRMMSKLGRFRYFVSFNMASSLILVILYSSAAAMCIMVFLKGHVMFRVCAESYFHFLTFHSLKQELYKVYFISLLRVDFTEALNFIHTTRI